MKKIFFVFLIVVLLSSVMTLPVCAATAPNGSDSTAPHDDLSVLDQILLELENNNMPTAIELVLTVILLPLIIAVGLLAVIAFLVFLAIKYIGIWLFFI